MKSVNIVFPEKGKIALIEQELPALGETQVLIKAEASLISIGTELRCMRGVFDSDTNWHEWVQYPFGPGYSMAGTIVETGSAVTNYKVGDRICTQSPHYQYIIQEADYVNLMLLPEGISFEEGAWQPLGGICQLGARRPEIQLGDDVGIVGLGMLGQLVTQYLHSMGVNTLLAIDVNKYRLEQAKKYGATHTFSGKSDDAMDIVLELTGGRKLDVIFDITGLAKTLSTITTLVHRGGKVILLGDNTQPSLQYLGPNVVSESISVLGIQGSHVPDVSTVYARWSWRAMASLYFDMLLDGRLNVKDMIHSVRSPADAEETYLWLENEKPDAFGVIFDWNMMG